MVEKLDNKLKEKLKEGLPIIFFLLSEKEVQETAILHNPVKIPFYQTRLFEVVPLHKPISKLFDISKKRFK